MSQFKEQYARLGMDVPETTDLVEKAEMIYKASCAKLGIDPMMQPIVSGIRAKYQARQIADYKLMIIRDAITDEREADWDDRSEKKYEGWFYLNKPGFRFGGTYCDSSLTCTASGSRLCAFSDNDQQFFMKEAIALWADQMGAKLPE